MDNYTQANLMGKVAGSSLPHCAVSLSVSLLFRYGGQRHQRQSERVQKTLFFVFVVNADCFQRERRGTDNLHSASFGFFIYSDDATNNTTALDDGHDKRDTKI